MENTWSSNNFHTKFVPSFCCYQNCLFLFFSIFFLLMFMFCWCTFDFSPEGFGWTHNIQYSLIVLQGNRFTPKVLWLIVRIISCWVHNSKLNFFYIWRSWKHMYLLKILLVFAFFKTVSLFLMKVIIKFLIILFLTLYLILTFFLLIILVFSVIFTFFVMIYINWNNVLCQTIFSID